MRSSKLYRSNWMMQAIETQKRRPFEGTGRADDYVRHVAVVRADAEMVVQRRARIIGALMTGEGARTSSTGRIFER